MVLTKDELIASLKNEVRILLHLAGKIDRKAVGLPARRRNSEAPLNCFAYLAVMGPMIIRGV